MLLIKTHKGPGKRLTSTALGSYRIFHVNYFVFGKNFIFGRGGIRGNKNGHMGLNILYMNNLKRGRIYRNVKGFGIGSAVSGRACIARSRGWIGSGNIGIVGRRWKNKTIG